MVAELDQRHQQRGDDHFGEVLAVGDFNGDDYDDLAIGIPDEDDGTTTVDSGRVAIRYGSSGGLTAIGPSQSFSQDGVAGNGNSDDEGFGSALAAGDFDEDGYDDLAIGVPFDNAGGAVASGRVVIMYGGSGGLSGGNSETFHQANFGYTPEDDDHFGSALAAGDFDDDGKDDLAIGASGEDRDGLVDVGWIHIKFGDDAGLKDSLNGVTFGHTTLGSTDRGGDRLGNYLAAGDIDADGQADLAMGIPEKNLVVGGVTKVDAGMVGILFGGSPSTILANGTNVNSVDAGVAHADDQNLGHGVYIANLDGDLAADVIAGAPRWSAAKGAVAVYFGHPTTGLSPDTQWIDETCMDGVSVSAEYFGRVQTAGDYDNDGEIDLAVSDMNEGTSYGAVRIAEIAR